MTDEEIKKLLEFNKSTIHSSKLPKHSMIMTGQKEISAEEYFTLSGEKTTGRDFVVQLHHLTPNEVFLDHYDSFYKYIMSEDVDSAYRYDHADFRINGAALASQYKDSLLVQAAAHSGQHDQYNQYMNELVSEIEEKGIRFESEYIDFMERKIRYENNGIITFEQAEEIERNGEKLKIEYWAKAQLGINKFAYMALQDGGVIEGDSTKSLLLLRKDDPRLEGESISEYYNSVNSTWTINKIDGGADFTIEDNGSYRLNFDNALLSFQAGVNKKELPNDKLFFNDAIDSDGSSYGYKARPEDSDFISSPDEDYRIKYQADIMALNTFRSIISDPDELHLSIQEAKKNGDFSKLSDSYLESLKKLDIPSGKPLPNNIADLTNRIRTDGVVKDGLENSKNNTNIVISETSKIVLNYGDEATLKHTADVNKSFGFTNHLDLSKGGTLGSMAFDAYLIYFQYQLLKEEGVEFEDFVEENSAKLSADFGYMMLTSAVTGIALAGIGAISGPVGWASFAVLGTSEIYVGLKDYLRTYIEVHRDETDSWGLAAHQSILGFLDAIEVYVPLESIASEVVGFTQSIPTKLFGIEAPGAVLTGGQAAEIVATEEMGTIWGWGYDAAKITGNEQNNLLLHSGYGEIKGAGGDDIILGWMPEKRLQGEYIGGDPIRGYLEEDTRAVAQQDLIQKLDGGKGNDIIFSFFGEEDSVQIIGGEGKDWIFSTTTGAKIYGDTIDGLDSNGNEISGEAHSDIFWYWPNTHIMDADKYDHLKFFGFPLVGGTNDIPALYGGFSVANSLLGGATALATYTSPIYFDNFLPFITYTYDGENLYVTNLLQLFSDAIDEDIPNTHNGHSNEGSLVIQDYQSPGAAVFSSAFFDESGGIRDEAIGDMGMIFKNANPYFSLVSMIAPGILGGLASIKSVEDKLLGVIAASLQLLESTKWSQDDSGESGGSSEGNNSENEENEVYYLDDFINPIVLDLDGDGLETSKINDVDIYFDIDSDLFSERVAWIDPDDGIIVTDVNNDGLIQDADEIIGSAARSGFEQLSNHDDDQNGLIDIRDSVYAELRIWRDINQDGKSNTTELYTLESLGVVSINLNPSYINKSTPQGNDIVSVTEVIFVDGLSSNAFEVSLAVNDSDTEYSVTTQAPLWATQSIDVKGFGNVTNLAIAAQNDFELSQLIASQSANITSPSLSGLLDESADILSHWGQALNTSKELVAVLVDKSGTQLLDRAVYTEDELGGYWYLESGGSVLNESGQAIERVSLQDVLSQHTGSDKSWSVELSWSPVSRSNVLSYRDEAPYLTSIVNDHLVVDDFAYKNEHGHWVLASGRPIIDDDGQVIVSPSTDDILALPKEEGQSWNLESIGVNPLAGVSVENIGVYVIDGIAVDYTVQVNDEDGSFFVWSRHLDRALELQFYHGDSNGFNLRNYEIDFDSIDEVNSSLDSSYRVELLSPGQFQFATSLLGVDFQTEMLNAHISSSGILNYSINDVDDGSGSLSKTEYQSAISPMLDTLAQLMDTYMKVGSALAVRLAAQGGLKEYFEGVEFIAEEDVFKPTSDYLLTPMFEAIFEKAPQHYEFGTPEHKEEVYEYLQGWNEILWQVYSDFEHTDGSVEIDQRTVTQMVLPVYEAVPLGVELSTVLNALQVDETQIATLSESENELIGTSGSDFIILSGDGTSFKGGAGRDVYFVGETFNDIVIEDIDFGEADELRFTELTSSQVSVSRDGQDLIIESLVSDSRLTVRNHFLGELNPSFGRRTQDTETTAIVFANGVVWDSFSIAYRTADPQDTDDVIVGSGALDVLIGGKGNDVLRGGTGGDIYLFERGHGQDVIDEDNSKGMNPFKAGLDFIQFKGDISGRDLHLERFGESTDLHITLKDSEGNLTSDSIVIKGQFDGARLNLDEFAKSYGSVAGIDEFASFDFDFVSSTSIERILFENGSSIDFAKLAREVVANAVSDGEDAIYGFDIDDRLTGGKGNDLLIGRAGADTYIYNEGDDLEEVKDGDLSIKLFGGGKGDQLRFSDHTWADIDFLREGYSDTLTLSIAGSDGTQGVVLSEFTKYQAFQGHINLIESIRFSDGTEWDYFELLQHYVDQSQTTGDDRIVGFDFSQILRGGKGNDRLEGLEGNDTYIFERGDGQDVVFDASGSADKAIFDGLSFNGDIVVSRTALDLIFTVRETGQSITFENQYVRSDRQVFAVETFEFSDVSLDFKQLNPEFIDRIGTSGSEILEGSDFGERIDGKGGDDTLIGASGGDTYVFDVGYGNDVIVDTQVRSWWYGREGFEREQNDKVQFGSLISRDIVSFSKDGDDLVITLSGFEDSLRIRNQFRDTVDGIEQFLFADGTSLSIADVEELLQIVGGNRGDNTITGIVDAPNVLDGRQGDDTLIGGSDSDIYAFSIGYDFDEVIESESPFNGSVDRIVFGKGITLDSLIVRRIDNDLLLDLGDGESVLTIKEGLSTRQVELFEFSDGTSATLEDIRLSMLSGSDGHDNISGFDDRDDVLNGGAGSDTLEGGLGNDKYHYGYGSGHDSIFDSGGVDQVIFSPGIRRHDVSFSAVEGNLLITLKESNETLAVLSGAEYGGQHGIESFVFEDGETLSLDEVLFRILREENWATSNRINLDGQTLPYEISPGRGNDWSYFSADTEYAFQAGDGIDTVAFRYSYKANVITFSDLNSTEVVVRYAYLNDEQFSSSNLVFEFPRTGDRLTIENIGSGTILKFADGVEWTRQEALAQLMENQASDSDDYITGSRFDDLIQGGKGDDDISGGSGNDVYRYSRGDGHDIIRDTAGINTLELFGFSPDEIEISQPILDRTDITLSFTSQEGSLSLQYDRDGDGIDKVAFSDGTVWDKAFLFESVIGKGTKYNDKIKGSSNDDVIIGFEGDDYLDGKRSGPHWLDTQANFLSV
ncbi:calcium-binding protein [Grimontia marina]|uniref:Bifunctional hemolysin/adenylate cyclase n=1 Tax=Grimontia marina TaxID=646534 RepID=A0A128EUN6_9GAMM|nr:calcium-binding protein [Grimontia marina]CZF77825.1 Bifunctional hemolysin/adenylate cyclase precursor [Grimontia marina]